jgi:hypothetical protein
MPMRAVCAVTPPVSSMIAYVQGLVPIAAATYAVAAPHLTSRAIGVLVLVAIWALRLSIYITRRNWGGGEDRRYQAIRARNQPHFALKSLYLVLALQAMLAWIVFAAAVRGHHEELAAWHPRFGGLIPVAVGILLRGGRELAARAIQSGSGQSRQGHGSGPVVLHPSPELFRRVCALVGLLLDRAVGRCVVEHRRSDADVGAAATGLRRDSAREGYRRAPACVRRL